MTPIYFTITSAFILSLTGLAFNRSHLLSALLCLEGMMLSLFLALAIWSLTMSSPSLSLAPMILLTFSACEASSGLALLVAATRTHGTDHLNNLNLLQC
uniref:NADH-ubiquinone oxidoreductase chain 4L n=1 Tax=Beringraja pulchra TaxID=1885022 RepID=A0A0H4JDG5_BERPU|nr:NADH dehydrogenase subunit 4L [Beringraja pulchra]YP_010950496.1 NADH dehydrogenase subunit 4L [Beringraja binoculata]AHA03931.1 NADH dehydrogenase subunit 4L [Beringraja pulchra]AKO71911.1 NADH dehydrogenase subunit 4L [Beringraja pulchra]AKO71924.1 NADH dehydrogenase subunit 4L [Beringraja pulchra]AKO71945.1 NADH dehydrogenase subunit 4L [Beringraja pulchra]AKO71958.1 NADH dehydrogenase subunit 4L [Beringraja pulchra]